MNVAVFCGSAAGHTPDFANAVKALGHYFAQQGIAVVYGGGNVGLMGVIADSVIAGGGQVIGVIPEHLRDRELAHPNLTELHVVADMHERKAKMAALADAFVALPGGVGTLEEIFEVWTWGQLGLHAKPCAFYNVNGFYDPLFSMVESMQQAGFVKAQYLDMLIREQTPELLHLAFSRYQPPKQKWS
ncbi:TIGR00730 family Rossman fold protein [Marinomonas transparens]|uniref:Cytokinin riboside 5'-monophosphate phosphoribohydrolase n=1 Tax=Marinomonas transparens TaxID=2795388 RepID=A0A934JQR7_9GAMM|nr:TIGR00730 family Rossman fold protein [Marinomonas transparens]MBJ7538083.1 TIGR00730 family Rossman fold protein [Marinomonas transparens]